MSLHWRKGSSGWFTVLDLQFIYRTDAHSPHLVWIGQESIRYSESTGSNLRYPPLPTLVWVWWGCILRLGILTWGRCDTAHWSLLGLFWMGSLWQLWTMQFTAWLKPHEGGVWRKDGRLKESTERQVLPIKWTSAGIHQPCVEKGDALAWRVRWRQFHCTCHFPCQLSVCDVIGLLSMWFALFDASFLICFYLAHGVGMFDLEILTFPKLCVM